MTEDTTMPSFQHGDATIAYEEFGQDDRWPQPSGDQCCLSSVLAWRVRAGNPAARGDPSAPHAPEY